MPAKLKIVLFEDTDTTRSELVDALREQFRGKGQVVPFAQFRETASAAKRMYEDRLAEILKSPPYSGATLLLADRDLSKSPQFVGLSVSAVAAAARRLAVPICSYARQQSPSDYKWRSRWQEGHIVLNFGSDEELVRKAVIAAKGFAMLTSGLPRFLKVKGNDSPAKLLAAVLGKPEYADKIALYSVGDQNRLSGIPSNPKDATLHTKKMSCFLGYWLWDSLLRYPGLLVNETAAASHLNIATKDFHKPAVRAVFKKAIYRGPFADSKSPQWWRGVLDDIVSTAGCDNGLAFVRRKVNVRISPCQCSVDSSKSAGYFCIISEKPVSLENSKGGLSWFPRGADLTRVSNKKFEEFGPWLGA